MWLYSIASQTVPPLKGYTRIEQSRSNQRNANLERLVLILRHIIKVLVKLFQKLAESRERVPCRASQCAKHPLAPARENGGLGEDHCVSGASSPILNPSETPTTARGKGGRLRRGYSGKMAKSGRYHSAFRGIHAQAVRTADRRGGRNRQKQAVRQSHRGIRR